MAGLMRSPPAISLNLMPAFYCKHLGVAYGEAYYFDPGYRAQVEEAENRLLHEILGTFGVGDPHSPPSGNIFIQPVDLILRTQGAQWRFPTDATLESVGTPWANLTASEICQLDPRAAAVHPVVEQLLDQYRVLVRCFGERADIFGIKSGTMNVHAPFTTAHRLLGERLFILLVEAPDTARQIFEKIWEIYTAIFDRIREATNSRVQRVQLGDCSASMLSPERYRSV
jgi:hypothetical protein